MNFKPALMLSTLLFAPAAATGGSVENMTDEDLWATLNG